MCQLLSMELSNFNLLDIWAHICEAFHVFLFNVPSVLVSLKVNEAKIHNGITSGRGHYIFVPSYAISEGGCPPHPPFPPGLTPLTTHGCFKQSENFTSIFPVAGLSSLYCLILPFVTCSGSWTVHSTCSKEIQHSIRVDGHTNEWIVAPGLWDLMKFTKRS